MILDMKTVMLIYAIIAAICAVFMAIMLHFNRRRFAGISFWLIGMILQTVGLILIVLRGIVPDFISLIVSNTVIIAGILIIYIGLERFVGKKSSQIHNYILLVIFIAIQVYFTYVQSNLTVRTFNITVITLILTFQCAWLMLRRVAQDMRRSTSIAGMVFSGYVFISIIRIILLVVFPLHSSDFFKSGLPDTFIIIFYTVLAVGLTFSLILMVNGRLIGDIRIYAEQRDNAASKLKERVVEIQNYLDIAEFIAMVLNAEQKIMLINRKGCEILGYKEHEIIGKNWFDEFIPKRLREEVKTVFNKLMAGKVKSLEYFENLVITRKGEERLIAWHNALIKDNDGRITGTLSSGEDITERIKAEEALRESEEKYRSLIEKANDSIAVLVDGIIRFSNPSLAAMLGYEIGEVDGFELARVIPPENLEWILERYRKRIAGEKLSPMFETVLLHKSGNGISVEVTGAVIQYEGKSADLMIMRDITGRKRTEEEQRKTTERLALACRAGSIGIWELDVVKNILSWDNQMFTLYGIAPDKFGGTYEAWRKGVHPDDLQKSEEELQMAMRGEKEFDTAFRVVWPDDTIHTIRALAKVQRDTSGKAIKLIGTNYDITESKKVEEALRDARWRQDNIIGGTNVGTWEWNVQTGETVFNERWAQIIGYTLDELAHISIKTLETFAHPDDLKQSGELLERHFAGELPYYDYESRMKHKDGHWVWVQDRGCVITRTGDGKPLMMFGTQTDITERKKTEEEIIYLSYHDQLTGLYNRRFVEEEIKRLDTKRQLPLSVIMGDLNGLKLTNDTFGHNEGDKILKEIAELLKRICRSDDILARWGGDEFVNLLPKTSITDSEEIVQRIKKECSKLIIQKIPLSLAIGIATKTEVGQDIDEIIIEAESNMYKNKLDEKESNAGSIIFALEQALSEKSSETMEHAFRIKDSAIKLGKSIKLHYNQLDELSLLASLHDIGKVAIPESILLKEGKLTEKEWAVIKRHPEIGFNIAQSSPQIVHIAKFILACHENWDGSGYPQGLAGESIPIVSRIMSIADAYDAMTNERTYKKAMSKDAAIEEFKRCAGTQFDPVLVNKFIEIISN